MYLTDEKIRRALAVRERATREIRGLERMIEIIDKKSEKEMEEILHGRQHSEKSHGLLSRLCSFVGRK